jgi:hypothetical protein
MSSLRRHGDLPLNTPRSFRKLALVAVAMAGLSACSSVLTNKPVSKTAEGWTVTLGQVKEGPDEYIGEGGIRLAADEDEKLVWADLTVKNDSAQEQAFTYDTCILDGKDQARHPMTVGRPADVDPEMGATVDRSEAYNPGQARTRQLIYRFAKDQRPTRLRCGALTLPIPAAR